MKRYKLSWSMLGVFVSLICFSTKSVAGDMESNHVELRRLTSVSHFKSIEWKSQMTEDDYSKLNSVLQNVIPVANVDVAPHEAEMRAIAEKYPAIGHEILQLLDDKIAHYRMHQGKLNTNRL